MESTFILYTEKGKEIKLTMASSNQFLILFALTAVLAPTLVVFAVEYDVGDAHGWNIHVNYTTWAAGKVFHLGDTLVFKYNYPPHNVHAVDGQDFESCSTKTEGLTTGNDKIKLDTPGKKWYICSFGQHCASGQKLAINVSATPTAAPNAAFALGANLYILAAAAMVGVAMMML